MSPDQQETVYSLKVLLWVLGMCIVGVVVSTASEAFLLAYMQPRWMLHHAVKDTVKAGLLSFFFLTLIWIMCALLLRRVQRAVD